MTRIFTTICLLAVSVCFVFAQSVDDVVFSDEDGNAYDDGATLVRSDYEEYAFGSASSDNLYEVPSGLYVSNNGDAVINVEVVYEIEEITRGAHQICFPSTCISNDAAGSYTTSRGAVKAGVSSDMQTEWFTGGDGNCTVTYTIYAYTYDSSTKEYTSLGEGPTITVKYVFGDDAGVDAVSSALKVVDTQYFDVCGRVTSSPSKGVYIKRMTLSDGSISTKKVILK